METPFALPPKRVPLSATPQLDLSQANVSPVFAEQLVRLRLDLQRKDAALAQKDAQLLDHVKFREQGSCIFSIVKTLIRYVLPRPRSIMFELIHSSG